MKLPCRVCLVLPMCRTKIKKVRFIVNLDCEKVLNYFFQQGRFNQDRFNETVEMIKMGITNFKVK